MSPHAAAETFGFLPGSVRNPPLARSLASARETGQPSRSPASAGRRGGRSGHQLRLERRDGHPGRSLRRERRDEGSGRQLRLEETEPALRSPASAGRDREAPGNASRQRTGFGQRHGLGETASAAAQLRLSCTPSDFGRKASQATSVARTREQRRGRDPHREVKAPQRGALEEPERMGRNATTQGLKPERRLHPDEPET